MMDLLQKKSEAQNRDGQLVMKSCGDCQTTRTPLWRGGPDGPKSLCNACGIKYNKKRRQLLGLGRGRKQSNKNQQKKKSKNNEVGRSLKMMRLVALGREMGLKISSSAKFGEEEEAALLLMALSCRSLSSAP